jgi:transcriptional regulator with PAS, ATPase and Fis domain
MLILIADLHGQKLHFPLREDLTEFTAGSQPENDFHLPYKGVSRRHFSITKNKQDWVLRDLESTNGTKHNGEKITEAVLHEGDQIQAGVVQFEVRLSEEGLLVLGNEKESEGTDKTRTAELSGSLSSEVSYSFPKLNFPEGMVPGASPAMLATYQKLSSVVDSDINVLLIGETGTGKEMIAKLLQLSGKRSKGPFITVNCAAIPSDLVESELFGIGERVATNVNQRKGKIVLADEGTLFLDELNAFPLPLQAKLLRAIEEKLIYPLGENKPVPVDFRLIAATNQNPEDLIRSQNLREDLYHRVAGLEITLPPLRDRKKDLDPLIVGLLRSISKREKKSIAGVSKNLLSLLQNYSYPGNVRELVNLLASMVALAQPGEMLDVHLAPGKLLKHGSNVAGIKVSEGKPLNLHDAVDEYTKKLILEALEQNDWNFTRTAKQLGITHFGLRKMMRRLGIQSR